MRLARAQRIRIREKGILEIEGVIQPQVARHERPGIMSSKPRRQRLRVNRQVHSSDRVPMALGVRALGE